MHTFDIRKKDLAPKGWGFAFASQKCEKPNVLLGQFDIFTIQV